MNQEEIKAQAEAIAKARYPETSTLGVHLKTKATTRNRMQNQNAGKIMGFVDGYLAALESSHVNPPKEGWIDINQQTPPCEIDKEYGEEYYTYPQQSINTWLKGRFWRTEWAGDDYELKPITVTHWTLLPAPPGEPLPLSPNPLLSPLKEAIEALRNAADVMHIRIRWYNQYHGQSELDATRVADQDPTYLACMEVINKSEELLKS